MADYAPDAIFLPASDLKSLAGRAPTPFYIYDAEGICQSAAALRQAFAWQPDFQNYFPLRENSNPALLRLLQENGLGVLACGRAELTLAKKCGFQGEHLLYEPMFQDEAAASLAQSLNAVWLLNAPGLIPMHRISRVLLRYHPQPARGIPNRPDRVERSKNGFMTPQLIEAIQLLHARGVEQIGLALQISSCGFQPGFYAARAETLFRLLPEIRTRTGVTIAACCLGDGLGPSYRPNTEAPQLREEAAQIRRLYEALPQDLRPKLCTALSKQLMEPHGLLVTRVLEIRALSRTFLVVDASMCQYLRPSLKQAYRHISLLGKNQTERRRRYQVAGYLPEEADLFGESRMLPEAEVGDLCIIHDVGCGGRSMPLLYAMQPPCAEYLFCPDGQLRQIGRACTEEETLSFLTAW